jgi:hypothetical protein
MTDRSLSMKRLAQGVVARLNPESFAVHSIAHLAAWSHAASSSPNDDAFLIISAPYVTAHHAMGVTLRATLLAVDSSLSTTRLSTFNSKHCLNHIP